MAPVDPGFTDGVRRHVEEDGRAVRAIAEAAEPALWDRNSSSSAVAVLSQAGRLSEARSRSLEQAREFLTQQGQAAIDVERELCHAHGAYGPEGDCFVCDTQQARERAEAAEAKLIGQVIRCSMRSQAAIFDLELVTKFTDLDRDRIEQALERLEDQDEVRSVYNGADRPRWTLVID